MLRYAFPLIVALSVATPALACGGEQACCMDKKSSVESKVSSEKITPAAAKAGETVRTFKVTGMTCTGCANKITKALTKEAGVVAAKVDAKTGEATVTYVQGQVDEAHLQSVIEKAGYKIDKQAV